MTERRSSTRERSLSSQLLGNLRKHLLPIEGDKGSTSERFHDPTVLPMLFRLADRSSESQRIDLYDQYLGWIQNNYYNIKRSCENGVSGIVLTQLVSTTNQAIYSRLYSILSALWSYSMSLQDIRSLFVFLHKPWSESPKVIQDLIRLLELLCVSKSPRGFFDLNGTTSGMLLQTLPKFPDAGYTFYSWIRFPSHSHISPTGQEQTIFCFTSLDGKGIKTVFNTKTNQIGTLQVTGEANGSTIKYFEYTFVYDRWHHIVVRHKYNRFTSSEIELFVGGDSVDKYAAKYPRIDSHQQILACIGFEPDLESVDVDVIPKTEGQFCGQIASIYFSSEILSNTRIKYISDAGISAASDFPLHESTSMSETDNIIEGKIHGKILLCYEPKGVSFDGQPLSVHKGHKITASKYKPKLFPGTEAHIRPTFSDAIQTVGSVTVLFPLISQLGPLCSLQSNDEIPSITQIIDLLVLLLQKSSVHLEALQLDEGFLVLGTILNSVKPLMFPEMFASLQHLEKTLVTKEMLLSDFYKYVLFNINIWKFSIPSLVVEWVELLALRVKENTKLFKELFGTGFLYDILFRYFSHKRQETCVSTSEDEANQLSEEHIRRARTSLASALHVMLTSSLNADELEKLLYHTENHDSTDAYDFLDLIYKLLCENVCDVCEYFESVGGPSTLYAMVSDKNSDVVHLSIRCLIVHLKYLSAKRKGKGKPGPLQMFSVLTDTIRTKEFDEALYRSLLGLALEELPDSKGSGFDLETPLFQPTIRHRHLIKYLFEKIVNLNPSMILRFIKEIHLLFKKKDENKVQFMTLNGWELILLNFLRFKRLLNNRMGENIYEEIMNIFLMLIQFRLYEKDGWIVLLEIETHIQLYYETKQIMEFDEFIFRKELFYKLACHFKEQEKLLVKGESVSILGENFIYFCCLMEDFMFYNVSIKERSSAHDFSENAPPASLMTTISDLPEPSVVQRRRSDTIFSDHDTMYPVKGLLMILLDVFDIIGLKMLTSTVRFISYKTSNIKRIKDGGLSRIFSRFALFCVNEAKLKMKEEKAKLKESERNYSPANRLGRLIHLDIAQPPSSSPEKSAGLTPRLIVVNDQFWIRQMSRLRILLEPLLNSANDNAPVLLAILYQLDQAISALVFEGNSSGKNEVAGLMKHIMSKKRLHLQKHFEDVPKSMYETDYISVLDAASPISLYLGHHFLPDWHGRFIDITGKMFSEAEEIENSFVVDVQAMKKAAFNKFKERRASVLTKRRALEDEDLQNRANYFNIRQQSREKKHARYISHVHSFKHMLDKGAERVKKLNKFMSSEMGPWSHNSLENGVYYKLDKSETTLRMRFRLKDFDEPVHKALLQTPEPSRRDENLRPDGISEKLEEALAKLHITPKMKGSEIDEFDLLADEDEDASPTNLPDSPKATSFQSKRLTLTKQLAPVPCEMISSRGLVKGKLDVNADHVIFSPLPEEGSKKKLDEIKFFTCDITAVHHRRYILRFTAIEVFLRNRRSYLINFDDRRTGLAVMKRLISNGPPHLSEYHIRSPAHLLRKLQLTERWQRREISNFEYLMRLNTIAGRTYNDLAQYPVFPWILTNYTSKTIDLGKPGNYRDLSKPLGALEPKRLATFRERFELMDSEDPSRKYMYHAHYSTAFSVYHYMIRLEPFTSEFIQYQDGKLDQPDRMFHSIPQSWSNRMNSSSDLFELIPEFFYNPEFLRNTNKYSFGVRQSGEPIDDVILPAWASTPEEFVRIHREALESEYVSAHIHEWIDLVFGFKQRGEEAIKADNLFHYLTYEGSIDIDAIEDPVIRHSLRTQIAHFGQTPIQLFQTPHPARNSSSSILGYSLKWSEKANTCLLNAQVSVEKTPVLSLRAYNDHIVSVSSDSKIWNNQLSVVLNAANPNPINYFQQNIEPLVFDSGLIVDTKSWQSVFAITADGSQILSAGHFDSCLKIFAADSGKLMQSLSQHISPIIVIEIVETMDDHIFAVTGSLDCTAIIWEGYSDKSFPLSGKASRKRYVMNKTFRVIYGHNAPVNAVAVSSELNCVATASKDQIILYSLFKHRFMRKIQVGYDLPLRNTSSIGTIKFIPQHGQILVFFVGNSTYQLFSINGRPLAKASVDEDPVCCLVLKNNKYFVSAGRENRIVIRRTHDLQVHTELERSPKHIRSVAITPNNDILAAGLTNGSVCLYALQIEKPPVDDALVSPRNSVSLTSSADDAVSLYQQPIISPPTLGFLSSLVGTFRQSSSSLSVSSAASSTHHTPPNSDSPSTRSRGFLSLTVENEQPGPSNSSAH